MPGVFHSAFGGMFFRPSTFTRRHCSFCLAQGHTIRKCFHVDVDYLFHEFMYFYQHYGEYFMSVNLTVLFQPHEAQALLHFPAIHNIRTNEPNIRRYMQRRNMVSDVMMTRAVTNIYTKLQCKIYSLNEHTVPRIFMPCMHIVESIMNQSIELYESFENNGPVTNGTIIAGYHNFFTQNRHARFRCYDYEIHYENLTIAISPNEDFPEHITQPIVGPYEFPRYGLGRAHVNQFPSTTQQQREVSSLMVRSSYPTSVTIAETTEEQEPEWLDTRPPSNVTVRSQPRTLRHLQPTYDFNRAADDMYQMLFEDWSVYSEQFETRYKLKQMELEKVEVEVKDKPCTNAPVECPICMTDMESSQTIFLGCCVYSFCSECYSHQYLSKEQRKHTCMMCRTPFTKVQVYDQNIADKLNSKDDTPPYYSSLDAPMTPSELTEIEEDFRTLGGEPLRISSFYSDEPLDTPMTLSELH